MGNVGKTKQGYNQRFSMSIDCFVQFSAFLYFCSNAVQALLKRTIGLGIQSNACEVILFFFLVVVACMANYRKYVITDFLGLYVGVLFFFIISLLIHPNYLYYYTRESYGVWDHVLAPHRGIYAYLFIRLLKTPEKIKSTFYAS